MTRTGNGGPSGAFPTLSGCSTASSEVASDETTFERGLRVGMGGAFGPCASARKGQAVW